MTLVQVRRIAADTFNVEAPQERQLARALFVPDDNAQAGGMRCVEKGPGQQGVRLRELALSTQAYVVSAERSHRSPPASRGAFVL